VADNASRLRAELEAAGGAGPGGSPGERVEAAIAALARHRGPDKSICPSDAARAVGGTEWRDLMDEAREAARRLAMRGRVQVTGRGHVLDPDAEWSGPIRIRIRDNPD
jgi:hypothetical protein